MQKLIYNIYNNLSERKYLKIQSKMAVWEHQMSTLLHPLNWKITENVSNNDVLIVDFIKRGQDFNGNIGIQYEDKTYNITFNFYVTKGFDENNYRYFLCQNLFINKAIDQINSDILTYTKAAIEIYESWTKDDLIKKGDKDKLDELPPGISIV